MNRRWEWALSLPSIVWLGVFFVFPTLGLLVLSLKEHDPMGGVGEGWSLDGWQLLADPYYRTVLGRSLGLSLVVSVVAVGLALPVSFWLARQPARWKPVLLLLIVLPFWSNFLIRIFAWKSLFHPEGWIQHGLIWIGLVEPGTLLLYNLPAVAVVLVYTSLPFALLPLYAAADRFDFGLLEAGRDLGAGRWASWWKVFVPGVRSGLIAAWLLVWIPAVGAYAIPDIVGGVSSEMWGNKIAQQVFTHRNLPAASALAVVLAGVVLLPLVGWAMYSWRREQR